MNIIPLINIDGKLFDHVSNEYIYSLKNKYPIDTTHFIPSCFNGNAYFYKIDNTYNTSIYNPETDTWVHCDQDVFFIERKNLIDIRELNNYLNKKT